MKDNKTVTLLKTGFADYFVCSIRWSSSGEDLILELAPPSKGDANITIKFVWAHKLTMNMTFGEYFGHPLIFSSSAKERILPETGWEILIEFGAQPDGQLSLLCNSIEIV